MNGTDEMDEKMRVEIGGATGANGTPRGYDLDQIRKKEWWTASEFGWIVNLSRPTVVNTLLKTGLIDYRKEGRQYRIHRSQLDVYNKMMMDRQKEWSK